MFEKDYVMRQIQMMVAALLRIMHLVNEKDFFTAKAEIKDAVKLITGFSLDQIKQLDIDDLKLIFSLNKENGNINAAYTGKLIFEEAKMLEEEKDIKQSKEGYKKALEIYEYLDKNNKIPENIEFDIKEEIKTLNTKIINHR
ncbi:MAG: hypothetical protein EHM58_11090 [Ignavibacteriae bacterium]|nr:MAG: hypothetical protein EHM58_11090 [Ignavibacteriota bacterium]